MSIKKAAKGDKFVCVHPKLGEALVGTVIALTKDETKMIGIEFDVKMNGHSCDDRGRNGHCLWVRPHDLLTIDEYENQLKAKEAAKKAAFENDLEEMTFE
jgi:hypothetical protein